MTTITKYKFRTKLTDFKHKPGDCYYIVTTGTNVPYIYNYTGDEVVGWIPALQHRSEDNTSPFKPDSNYSINGINFDTKEVAVYFGYDVQIENTTKKESMLTQILEINKQAAIAASKLEAGRLATNTLTSLVEARFPQLPSTPLNGLILANVADVVAKNFKPSPRLNALTNAMVVSAYSDLLQGLDLEGLLTQFLESTKQIEIPE